MMVPQRLVAPQSITPVAYADMTFMMSAVREAHMRLDSYWEQFTSLLVKLRTFAVTVPDKHAFNELLEKNSLHEE